MIQAQKYNIKINLWGQEEDVGIELLDQAIKPRMKCENSLKVLEINKSSWFIKLALLELEQCFSQLF